MEYKNIKNIEKNISMANKADALVNRFMNLKLNTRDYYSEMFLVDRHILGIECSYIYVKNGNFFFMYESNNEAYTIRITQEDIFKALQNNDIIIKILDKFLIKQKL